MLLRTRLYQKLNHLFGTPEIAEDGDFKHTESIYNISTLPLLENHRYIFSGNALIIGCGSGIEISWIAKHCDNVAAVDVSENAIKRTEQLTKYINNVTCFNISEKLPFEDEAFDVIFMHDVCEHIIDLEFWFTEYYRVLKSDGIFLNQFSPLFYSPYGAHLHNALKLPWGHLIFGLQSVIELRNQYYPGEVQANQWSDIGLNRLTLQKYQNIKKLAGFKSKDFSFETSKQLPLGWIPGLRNLFILSVTDILIKNTNTRNVH